MQDKKVEIITPLKSWWSGDSRVEEFMPEVSKAIKRHHDWPSSEYTDIYNRAYEAVYEAIVKYTNVNKHEVREFQIAKTVITSQIKDEISQKLIDRLNLFEKQLTSDYRVFNKQKISHKVKELKKCIQIVQSA